MNKLEKTVLKKAGIIVAVAAAGALALAPLAFAAESTQTTENSPSCTFANGSDSRGGDQAATGVASPLLGIAGTAANVTAPVTAQANAPVASCNNFSDLFDIDSNNKTKDIDNSKDVTTETSVLNLLGL